MFKCAAVVMRSYFCFAVSLHMGSIGRSDWLQRGEKTLRTLRYMMSQRT